MGKWLSNQIDAAESLSPINSSRNSPNLESSSLPLPEEMVARELPPTDSINSLMPRLSRDSRISENKPKLTGMVLISIGNHLMLTLSPKPSTSSEEPSDQTGISSLLSQWALSLFQQEPKDGLNLIHPLLMSSHHNGTKEDVLELKVVHAGEIIPSLIYHLVQDSNKPICNKPRNVPLNNGLMDSARLEVSVGSQALFWSELRVGVEVMLLLHVRHPIQEFGDTNRWLILLILLVLEEPISGILMIITLRITIRLETQLMTNVNGLIKLLNISDYHILTHMFKIMMSIVLIILDH